MIHCLRHRDSVRFAVIAPAGFRILSALDAVAQHLEIDLTITSGTDSHVAPDPHAEGEAFDVSVIGLSSDQIHAIKSTLEQILGPLFTVLYEVPERPSDALLRAIAYVNYAATGPHFHIQSRKGTVYPPMMNGVRA